MISLTLAQFKKLAKKGNLIPIYQEIPADTETPISAFLKIRSGKNDFLLESAIEGKKWGRFSFLGTNPREIFRSKNEQRDPLHALKRLLKKYRPVQVDGLPRFFGGAVGYLAYDMVRYFEKLPNTTKDELTNDDCYLMITDTVVIFDNMRHVMQVVANVKIDKTSNLEKAYNEGKEKIKNLIKQLAKQAPDLTSKKKPNLANKTGTKMVARHTEAEFCRDVARAKEYITAGDIFQVQVSTRFEADLSIDPFLLYRAIRSINPSPYLYFLELDGVAIVGASPELMVRLEDSKMELRPIAGTRRRGKTPEEDKEMEMELKVDPKERAEHIMLVDLGRNDLGRVCEAASVKVDEQEVIERYSHVMHLVSHVSGVLKKGLDVFDAIRAAFPAGTLTGAPKIRAMEIIEELEGIRRGIYGGAVGYISFTGNMDMAIAIRTAIVLKDKVYVQAAAGISW